MVARIQGFPDSWEFAGGKTAQYRRIGNALPPPVAAAVGRSIHRALTGATGSGDIVHLNGRVVPLTLVR